MLDVRLLICAAIFALVGAPCSGREIFHLRSGFSLEAQSHDLGSGTFVLKNASGTMELPIADVVEIESVNETDASAHFLQKRGAGTPEASRQSYSAEAVLATAAAKHGLTPEFVRSVAKIESGLRQEAISSKGASGLMQLMPSTAASLGVSSLDAESNAAGGAKYLRDLLMKYNGDAALALAAYNAGPGSVARFGGIPPYAETRRYIVRVLREYAKEQSARNVQAVNSSNATR